ncbi:hypothetical protein V1264_010041 [Littorina saxatilis]
MCPWCWIGKKKLEAGIKQLEGKFQFRVRWLPYLLRPQIPPEGLPIPPGYRNPARLAQMIQAGEEVGIKFSFSNTSFPNTLKAHALLELADSKDDGAKQNDVAERLFKAYFTDGKMLTEEDVVQVGQEAGFDPEEVRSFITDQEKLDAILQSALERSSKGVEGVPFFYFNGQRMFSGAQNEDVFTRMLTIAAERFPVAQLSKA